jgi:hypothetical protein
MPLLKYTDLAFVIDEAAARLKTNLQALTDRAGDARLADDATFYSFGRSQDGPGDVIGIVADVRLRVLRQTATAGVTSDDEVSA